MMVGALHLNAGRRLQEVTNTMAPDDDATIKAKLLKTLHRGGYYAPRGISVTGLVNAAPVPSEDVGRAKELVHDMAASDEEPVTYKVTGEAVMLESSSESEDWTAARIRHYDEEQLTWDLK